MHWRWVKHQWYSLIARPELSVIRPATFQTTYFVIWWEKNVERNNFSTGALISILYFLLYYFIYLSFLLYLSYIIRVRVCTIYDYSLSYFPSIALIVCVNRWLVHIREKRTRTLALSCFFSCFSRWMEVWLW